MMPTSAELAICIPLHQVYKAEIENEAPSFPAFFVAAFLEPETDFFLIWTGSIEVNSE